MSSVSSAHVSDRAPAVPGIEVMEVLGSGAQSVVYRVRRKNAKRSDPDFAMKVVRRSSEASRRILAMLRREAALLAMADHPGLAMVHEVGEAQEQLYLIMDMIDGRSLADTLVREGPLDQHHIVTVGVGIADVLAAIHRLGIVHRDVKPHNIMVQDQNTVRLIDLGIAARELTKEEERGKENQGDEEEVAGTLMYAAPEQTGAIKRPVDGRCDLYSLGVVLYECAAGAPPFTTEDIGELLRSHAMTPPPDLRKIRPDLDPTLVKVIERLLAKDPDDRYPGCAEVIADLVTVDPSHTLVRAVVTGGVLPWVAGEGRLVGRDEELADILRVWERVRSGQGGVVVLRGGSGSGKTRLADEVSTRIRRAGLPVMMARCRQGADPLSALSGAISEYVTWVDGLESGARHEVMEWVRSAGEAVGSYLGSLTPEWGRLMGWEGAPPTVTGQARDGFVQAVSGFVSDMARAAGGAVMVVDDARWLDGAARQVMGQIASQIATTPLLIIVTLDAEPADTDDSDKDLLGFLHQTPIDIDMTMGSLSREALVDLVTSFSGRLALDSTSVERIVARGGGTALGTREYLTAVVDAGLVVPRWGPWSIDVDGLDEVALPEDVVGLLLRRVENLGPVGRELLTVAAVVGVRFSVTVPAEVCGIAVEHAGTLVEQAVAHRVLERVEGGFGFVHDRIRRVLMEDLPPERLTEIHHHIATLLLAEGEQEGPWAYAVARHLVQAGIQRNPQRAFHACVRAGRQAMIDHATAEAVEFFTTALLCSQEISDFPQETPLGEVHELLGTALYHAGRIQEAIKELEHALDMENDPLARARTWEKIARLYRMVWIIKETEAAGRRGLAELGVRLRGGPVVFAVTSIAMFVAALFMKLVGIGFGTRDPNKRERFRLLACLHNTLLHANIRAFKPITSMLFTFRAYYAAVRVGLSPEYVTVRTSLASFVSVTLGRPDKRGFTRVARIAHRVGHPDIISYVELIFREVHAHTGTPDVEKDLRWLERHSSQVPAEDQLDYTMSLWSRLYTRGRFDEAMAAAQRGLCRLVTSDIQKFPLGQIILTATAALGKITDARENLRLLEETTATVDNPGGKIFALAASATLALEQGEFGEIFDRIAAEYATLNVNPMLVLTPIRYGYVSLTYGRIEQARLATGEKRKEAIHHVEVALRQLWWACQSGGGPRHQNKIHYRVALANLWILRGNPHRALRELATVDHMLYDDDVPIAAFEAACCRARALIQRGREDEAHSQAITAIALAERMGWSHRAERVRREFTVTGIRLGSTVISSKSNDVRQSDRRLAAIEQLSVTASKILDPDHLIRVALDETIRILNAERAYLFLTDLTDSTGTVDRLIPHLGRDADGNDLDILTDYGSTVVERVRHSREPIIVTGTDEGAALGSHSVVTHGLRSILVAPMLFDNRLLGVIYLDSRIAKGIFGTADVGILTVVTNHIAAGLETARAAQLAVAIHAAEQQRDVADKLRAAMIEFSESLNPDDVIRRLHASLERLLPAETGVLILPHSDNTLLINTEPGLDTLLASPTPIAGTGTTSWTQRIFGWSTSDSSWLVVPLHHRDVSVGAIALATRTPGSYGATEIQLAAALTSEGMVAYDNAQLFQQVTTLASTDVLTGVSTRRHFFALAETDVAHADPYQHITAIMIDIDKFKQVNDTYGHHVGDQVIAAVAHRLRHVVRSNDRIGRYGGEEFALLTSSEPSISPTMLGERLRHAIGEHPIPTDAGDLPITISVGICQFKPQTHTLAQALTKADAALYQAKEHGRNRVITTDSKI